MAFLEGKVGEIEKQIAEGEAGEAVVEPGDPNYAEVRERLLNAANSPEELHAVQERYPFWTPAQGEFAQQQQAAAEANAERNAVLEKAETPEEFDAVYEKYPQRLSPEDQKIEEYREAMSNAYTLDEIDEVYRRFGKPVPERDGVNY